MFSKLGPQQKKFLLFLLVLAPVYAVVTLLFYAAGPHVVQASLPTVEKVLAVSYPDMELDQIEYGSFNGRRMIRYRMKITKYLEGISIPLIDYLSSSLYISSQFVSAIIFYSLLFSWTFISWRKRIIAGILLTPFVLLFILIDIPVSVVTSIEFECQNKLPGYRIVETLPRQTIMFLGHFINNGGRQFLGVLLFALAVAPFHVSFPGLSSGGVLQRNDPCPCGSGKKYKNCCMKK